MKHIVSISLGSSSRDKSSRTVLLGEEYLIDIYAVYYSVDEIRELQILVVEMKKELRELKGGA